MKICPITYKSIEANQKYSKQGLSILAKGLETLQDLPYSAAEQRKEATARAGKMSIQGVQPKLSARLSVSDQTFKVVDRNGRFILKPQTLDYEQLPENEDVTMRLAELVGIEVPQHGLVYSRDQSMTYFIRRFDRVGSHGKLAVEDFAQLSGMTRDTKYDSSMETIAQIVDSRCAFPLLERQKLLTLTIFNFLVGNEDMHLKNFSLITRDDKIELSPAYDLLNTTIAVPGTTEELALPLNGKKKKITRKMLLEYFGQQRLSLRATLVDEILGRFVGAIQGWEELINVSFLSQSMKTKYLELLLARRQRLDI